MRKRLSTRLNATTTVFMIVSLLLMEGLSPATERASGTDQVSGAIWTIDPQGEQW
jgi:hypothetical protein